MPQLKALRDIGCTIDEMTLTSTKNIFCLVRNIVQVKKRSVSYDLVHCQFGSTTLLSSLLVKKPIVVSLRGSDLLCYWGFHAHTLYSIIAYMITILVIAFKKPSVITMSIEMKRRVSLIPGINTYILPDPIDVPQIYDCLSTEKPTNATNNFGNDDFLVIFGSLHRNSPLKRFSMAKEACELANYLSSRQIVLTLLESEKRSIFLNQLYRSDCLILTSVYEGWPNVIKEALALGKQVVATNVSDLELWSKYIDQLHVCKDALDMALTLKKIADGTIREKVDEGSNLYCPLTGSSESLLFNPKRSAQYLLRIYTEKTYAARGKENTPD